MIQLRSATLQIGRCIVFLLPGDTLAFVDSQAALRKLEAANGPLNNAERIGLNSGPLHGTSILPPSKGDDQPLIFHNEQGSAVRDGLLETAIAAQRTDDADKYLRSILDTAPLGAACMLGLMGRSPGEEDDLETRRWLIICGRTTDGWTAHCVTSQLSGLEAVRELAAISEAQETLIRKLSTVITASGMDYTNDRDDRVIPPGPMSEALALVALHGVRSADKVLLLNSGPSN